MFNVPTETIAFPPVDTVTVWAVLVILRADGETVAEPDTPGAFAAPVKLNTDTDTEAFPVIAGA